MPNTGQIIGEKYRLEYLVGSGGFATVWAARNLLLDRIVALKILSENFVQMPGFLPRFLREAKLASRSIHQNIVAVEDIDQTPEGMIFLVMELLQGHTVSDEIKGGKSLEIEWATKITTAILEGLAAAHQLNIIHRDIKPANIFITNHDCPGPTVRILDLGLAIDLLHDEELTSTNQMVGTPSYLAPEMFLGPQTKRWTPAADVFSCGMLMFRMLAGGLPFDKSVSGLTPMKKFLARAEFYQKAGSLPGPAQYNASIPPSIDAVVRKALCLDIKKRYANAGEMLADLAKPATKKQFVLSKSEEQDSPSRLLIQDFPQTHIQPQIEPSNLKISEQRETKKTGFLYFFIGFIVVLGTLAGIVVLFFAFLSPGFHKSSAANDATTRERSHDSGMYDQINRYGELSQSSTKSETIIRLEIHSSPSGATVFIDGSPVGKTPYELTGLPSNDEHIVAVSAAGYSTLEQKIQLHQSQRIEFELQQLLD